MQTTDRRLCCFSKLIRLKEEREEAQMVKPKSYFKDYEAEAKGGVPSDRYDPSQRVPRLAGEEEAPLRELSTAIPRLLPSGCKIFQMCPRGRSRK